MNIKVEIFQSNNSIKNIQQTCEADIPSMIKALGTIKDSTNSFLTDLIQSQKNGKPDESGEGKEGIDDDEGGDDDEDDEEEDANSDYKNTVNEVMNSLTEGRASGEKRKANKDAKSHKRKK